MKRRNRRKRRSWLLIATGLVLLLLAWNNYFYVNRTVSGDAAGLTVHFLDVGQADCALLLSGGHSMLIDAGNRDDGEAVVRYIRERGIQKLDYAIFTHPHEDHIGGGSAVLEEIPAGHVFMLSEYHSKTAAALKQVIDRGNFEVSMPKAGGRLSFGECRVEFLGPLTNYEDVNDDSIVLKVTHGRNRFLFTGDAGRAAEADLLEAGADLEAEVLKAGHHGSGTSTSYRFLREVNPQYAVISCGKENPYGHPHGEVLSRFRDAGVRVLRTDQEGTVILRSDGKKLSLDNYLPAFLKSGIPVQQIRAVFAGT